jgi:FkbM family methyltransferase
MRHLTTLLENAKLLGLFTALHLGLWRKFGTSDTVTIRPRCLSKPFTLRRKGSDYLVLRQVLGGSVYDSFRIVTDGMIIDAGANIGIASARLATLYPARTIVAIEPDSDNFSLLTANTASYGNIICIKGAVWPHNSRLAIINPEKDSWELAVKECPDGPIQGYTVSTLLEHCSAPRCALLKLDIEGSEAYLFSTPQSWLDKVDRMLIECHDSIQPGVTTLVKSAVGEAFEHVGLCDEYHMFVSRRTGGRSST